MSLGGTETERDCGGTGGCVVRIFAESMGGVEVGGTSAVPRAGSLDRLFNDRCNRAELRDTVSCE